VITNTRETYFTDGKTGLATRRWFLDDGVAELAVSLLPEPAARAVRRHVYGPSVSLVPNQETRKRLPHDTTRGQYVPSFSHLFRALEPYGINIPTKFAQTISMMFYTAFYSIFFPPGIIFTLIGLAFHYWIGKVGSYYL
jgi:hypothetical protein